ncbi:hypothetical protein HDV00_011761 [Rhizophlyctis rosea]|nr:hypothetical protein HDV00_011761 [Rhizophlyctis rosea]
MRTHILLLALTSLFALVAAQTQPDVNDGDEVEVAGGVSVTPLLYTTQIDCGAAPYIFLREKKGFGFGFNNGNNGFNNNDGFGNKGAAHNRFGQKTNTKADKKTDQQFSTDNINWNRKNTKNVGANNNLKAGNNFGTGFKGGKW